MIYSIKISADGNSIISSSGDRSIKFWRKGSVVESTHYIETNSIYDSHGTTLSIDTTEDMSLIISGNTNKSLNIWQYDNESGKYLLNSSTKVHDDDVYTAMLLFK